MTPRYAAAAVCCTLAVLVGGLQSRPAAPRLRVDGRAFRTSAPSVGPQPDGSRFSWRGLTAFRLVEMVAHGRVRDAVSVMDWARSKGVTVLRVLTMADALFKLPPADGRAALPRVLALAGARGLHVEAVALADTGLIPVSIDEQAKAVGAICAASANCVLELANEPWVRRTQSAETGDPSRLFALRALVPRQVPVALGSAPADDSDAFAGGDYVTVHVRRDGGWASVVRMRVVEAVSARTGKPAVDDEPIGAAQAPERGRRDADTSRWFARGVVARALGIGATFHYQGGIEGRVLHGQEAACFDAWRSGLDALPAGLEDRAVVKRAGEAGAAVQSFDAGGAADVFLAQEDRRAWAIAVGVEGDPKIVWRDAWRVASTRRYPGVVIVEAERAR